MNNSHKFSVALAASAAMTAGLALSPAQADTDTSNPFASTTMSSGYTTLAKHHGEEGKCGEAKCGGDKDAAEKDGEGKCGEAKCGANKADTEKDGEGKCGEAKCGANK